jgi:hypothetical protein
MHGGRKHGLEIYGVISSRRPRHTRGCSAKQEKRKENERENQAIVFKFPVKSTKLFLLVRSVQTNSY